jgi:hypothetical protein
MSGTSSLGKVCRIVGMEESGEQCNVVFAFVTEPAVCVCRKRGDAPPPPAVPVTIYAKTTVGCSPDSSMIV